MRTKLGALPAKADDQSRPRKEAFMMIAILIGLPAIGIFAALASQESRSTRRAQRRGAVNHQMPARGLPLDAHVVGQDNGRKSPLQATAAPTVSVIIPTLNEVGSLTWVLQHLPEWVSEVVLVDGLSTDRTELLARRLRPEAIVVHQYQRGKGAALRAGFAAAAGDIVVMIDADGSTDPREMGRFIEALKDGADFAKGSRHMEGGGSADFTRLRAAGNKAFVLMANMLYGTRFTDLCYGYCAFWRRNLDKLGLTADGFEIETQLVLGAVKAGLEIREVPSFELERRSGTSNLNAARDGIRILRTMVGKDVRRADGATHFTLRKEHLPVWSTDHLPAVGERRSVDRRISDPQLLGYVGPERRSEGESRQTDGTVVAFRAVYYQPATSDLDLAA
jgi:Glycosyl transferase family 2